MDRGRGGRGRGGDRGQSLIFKCYQEFYFTKFQTNFTNLFNTNCFSRPRGWSWQRPWGTWRTWRLPWWWWWRRCWFIRLRPKFWFFCHGKSRWRSTTSAWWSPWTRTRRSRSVITRALLIFIDYIRHNTFDFTKLQFFFLNFVISRILQHFFFLVKL